MQSNKCIIFTHRGLEPSNLNFYPESSYESFKSHLERGFEIEFDLNFTKNSTVIFHDSDLKRITLGKDNRKFSEISLEEIKKIRFGKNKQGRFTTLQEILDLIRNSKSELNALHLKGKFQIQSYLDILISILERNRDILNKILIFDIKPDSAKYLKSKIKELILSPSISHPYDIKRYSSLINNTLISIQDALKNKDIYEWVWLDEWDTLDENAREKKLYTKENFQLLKKAGCKIALVTPELHGISPGLYGGEFHKDAKNKEILFKRIKEILELRPDAICTDYPEEARKMII